MLIIILHAFFLAALAAPVSRTTSCNDSEPFVLPTPADGPGKPLLRRRNVCTLTVIYFPMRRRSNFRRDGYTRRHWCLNQECRFPRHLFRRVRFLRG